MDKLKSIKIKYQDGTYSDEIPIGVSVENVDYNDTKTLKQVLNLDVTKGTVEERLNKQSNDISSMSATVNSANENASAASDKADAVDTRLNNIIVESGTSEAEVVAARTDSDGQTFTTLGERLDTQFGEIKEDLSDLQAKIEGGGLTVRIKHALMQLANYVAFKNNDPNAQVYIDELYNSLFDITDIRLSSSSLGFTSLGATQQLTATTTPKGGNVVWASSDTSIATVDQTGLVTSVAYGSVTITATSGSVSASCPVVIEMAAVTSLSAVYSPSDNVYEGASLDSLKSDLVVTAHWSNGTTTTVSGTDYSLSGTLVEGTNTITVAYGGQTTTFNATVLPGPEYETFTPDNYVQGYYIEADGTVTASQYGSMSETYYDAVWKSLKFTSSVDFRVSFYDRNKTFLYQVVFKVVFNPGGNYDAQIKAHSGIVSVSDDAKYFRLSWTGTNNVEFTVENEKYTDLAMVSGDIDITTGLDKTEPRRIRSVDYLPVSDTTLQVVNRLPFRKSVFGTSGSSEYVLVVRCYDSSKAFVGSVLTTKDDTYTLPANTAFIRPIIQLGGFDIQNDFADYIYMPLTLNSENYKIVGA